MSNKQTHFHEFALQSVLFKGHADWYFCFLKAEKIAHVLGLLADRSPEAAQGQLHDLYRTAARLPAAVAHFAAGETAAGSVFAQLFALLATVRLVDTRGFLATQTAQIIATEYEMLAEKFAEGLRASPFLSVDDFSVAALPTPRSPEPLLGMRTEEQVLGSVRDTGNNKRHIKDTTLPRFESTHSKGQQIRLDAIKDFILTHQKVSIKDIAAVVRDCSEKTIQRELGVLIGQGVVRKVGERRWSLYVPA